MSEEVEEYLQDLADSIGISEDEAHAIFGTCELCKQEVQDYGIPILVGDIVKGKRKERYIVSIYLCEKCFKQRDIFEHETWLSLVGSAITKEWKKNLEEIP